MWFFQSNAGPMPTNLLQFCDGQQSLHRIEKAQTLLESSARGSARPYRSTMKNISKNNLSICPPAFVGDRELFGNKNYAHHTHTVLFQRTQSSTTNRFCLPIEVGAICISRLRGTVSLQFAN